MDKVNAIKLTTKYLNRVRENNIKFSEAWLFGSYAKEKQNENSDIDLAIVLDDCEIKNFDIDVRLMVIRDGDETIIEPHTFSKVEFDINTPIVNQIICYGEKIEI